MPGPRRWPPCRGGHPVGDGMMAKENTPMSHDHSTTCSDDDLQALIATGTSQGYLTYDQVNTYLPDEAVDPEKIDSLLVALEDRGIDLVDTAPTDAAGQSDPLAAEIGDVVEAVVPPPTPRTKAKARSKRDEAITTPPSNAGNDPIP